MDPSGHARERDAHGAGLTLQHMGEQEGAEPGPLTRGRGGAAGVQPAGDHFVMDPGQTRVVRRWSLGDAPDGSPLKPRPYRKGQGGEEVPRRGSPQAVAKGGGIAEQRTTPDHRRVVSHHVGQQQAHDSRAIRRQAEQPSGDCGQVLPEGIDLMDGGPRPQEQLTRDAQVVKGQALRGNSHQRTGTSGYQGHHQVVGTGPGGRCEHAPAGVLTPLVGERMPRLHDLHPPSAHASAAGARYHSIYAGRQVGTPRLGDCILQSSRHPRRGLPRTHDHESSRWPSGREAPAG